MTRWRVRPIEPDEAAILAKLEAAAFGPASWGASSVKAGVNAPYVSVLLAFPDEAEDAEAFALWRTLGDEGEILSIGAAPDSRRRGGADALLGEILSAAVAGGLTAMFLEVDAKNLPAIKLYEKHGFEQVGLRPNYYRTGADALVLKKRL